MSFANVGSQKLIPRFSSVLPWDPYHSFSENTYLTPSLLYSLWLVTHTLSSSSGLPSWTRSSSALSVVANLGSSPCS